MVAVQSRSRVWLCDSMDLARQAAGICSNSCPLSPWCHPPFSSSVVPFSSCPQSSPAPTSFPTSRLFASGGQNTGVSASASVLPVSIQRWCSLRWTGRISLQSNKGLLRVFPSTTIWMSIRHKWCFSLTWNAAWNRGGVWVTVYFGVFLPATMWCWCPPDGSAKAGKTMRWHSGFFQTCLPILLHLSLRAVLPGQPMQESREALKKISIQAEGASRHLKIRELANTPHSICFAFLNQLNYFRCVSLTFLFFFYLVLF